MRYALAWRNKILANLAPELPRPTRRNRPADPAQLALFELEHAA